MSITLTGKACANKVVPDQTAPRILSDWEDGKAD